MNDGVSTTKNIKWITGVSQYVVQGDDDVLNVDTSSNAVTIILPNIVNAGLDLFPKKIKINDASANAATNNITIASVGCNVNGAASTLIDTNSGNAECETSGNTDWLVNKSTDGNSTGGFSQTDILRADLLTLYNAGTLVVGYYNITDRADRGIVVQAVSTSKLSLNATALFLNADYQGVGDYSGVSSFVAQRGVWYSSMPSVVAHDVVIWGGNHYANKSGVNGGAPDITPADWTILSKASGTALVLGYIEESDYIEYDIVADVILKRADKRGNVIIGNDNNAINLFQFGNNNVVGNVVTEEAVLSCINSRAGFIGDNNIGINASILIGNSITGNIYYNNIKGSIHLILSGTGNFESCTIDYCNLSSPNTTNINLELLNVYSPAALNSISRFCIRNNSNFTESVDITDLTELAFANSPNMTGNVIVASTNATETITDFSGFPTNQPVRFYPKLGLAVLFDDSAGGFKNKTEDGPITIDGTKHDWIEYTKGAGGIIYETAKGKYS